MAKNFWILTGTEENWDVAFNQNKWGARLGLKKRWEKILTGDLLVFYVTSPISGVIGLGKVIKKSEEKTPYWPDEIREKKVIYPFRFYFDLIHRIPALDWKEKKVFVRDLAIPFQAGINSLSDKNKIKALLERIGLAWEKDFSDYVKGIETKKKEAKKPSPHNLIRDRLAEIGKLRGKASETEYPMDGKRLDVVWKQIKQGHPHYVFEIQVGGNLVSALGKLKHAWDLWSSKLYLVTKEKYEIEARKLVSGMFHEIETNIKIIPIEKIEELYRAEKEAAKRKEETGLI